MEAEQTVVQIQALIRASDPIYELGCRLGVVHKNEDAFWEGTLTNLAAAPLRWVRRAVNG